MDLNGIDLNLLVVFDAIADTRSVSAAGRRLGLSQPAMSYALGKLRTLFDDPLFMRVGHEMLPTPRASRLAGPVREALARIREVVQTDHGFTPATTERAFTLCLSDIGEMVFLPPLIRTLVRDAPRASLATTYVEPARLTRALEAGEVDLAVGYFPDLKKADIVQQQLSVSDFACIARRDNALIGDRLTRAKFFALPHVSVRAPGRTQELFENTLARQRARRRELVTVPHFLSLMELISGTDLIATVPRVLAERLARAADIRVHPLPMPSPRFAVKQFWHRRFHRDAANQWIRSVVRGLFQR